MRLRKQDKIKVISGKDKGKRGTIDKVYPKQKKVRIAGINLYKKHIKKNEKMPQGGVVEIPRPICTSKIMFVCPKCQKSTRIKYEIKKGKKNRICIKCSSIV